MKPSEAVRATPAPSEAAHEIIAPLERVRARLKLYASLGGLTRVVLVVILSALAQLVLDRWLGLSLDQRAFFNAVLTILWLWAAYRFVVSRIVADVPDHEVAVLVDRALPALHDELATAVQFMRGDVGDEKANSPELVRAVVNEAAQDARRIPFLSILDHRAALQRAGALAGLAAMVALAFYIAPELMRTWFARNWMLADIPWPQKTYLIPQGFDQHARLRFPRGDELTVVAMIEGELPATAEVVWRTPSGRTGTKTMTLVGADVEAGVKRTGAERFEAALGMVSEDVYFRLAGGDERTREYVVQTVDRPQIVRTLARVRPPAYTGLQLAEVERQTTIEVPKGADLEINAWTNKRLSRAAFHGPDGAATPCELLGDEHIRVRLSAPVSGVGRFELTDRDGWKDRNPLRIALKVVPDKPPAAKMELAGLGEIATPQAAPDMTLAFEDAYGLVAVEFVAERHRKGGATQTQSPPEGSSTQPASASDPSAGPSGTAGHDSETFVWVPDEFPLKSATTQPDMSRGMPPVHQFSAAYRFDFARMGAAAGDQLRLQARATDNDPAGPNYGVSPTVDVKIVTPEEFMAHMSQREFGLRQEFERLITSQRILNDSLDRTMAELPAQGSPAPMLVQRLAALARQQEQHGRRCLQVRQHFEKMLAEMWTNKAAGAAVERRVTDGIITPLGELARQRMPAGATNILGLRDRAGPEQKQAVRDYQDELLRLMRSILASMLRWEGYQEAVSLLKEIIGEQAEVRTRTLEAMSEQLEDILGTPRPEKPK